MMVIREDSTRSDPEPGHSIVIHFQGQEHHVEVRDWAGGLGVACSRVGNWSSTQQEVSPDSGRSCQALSEIPAEVKQ